MGCDSQLEVSVSLEIRDPDELVGFVSAGSHNVIQPTCKELEKLMVPTRSALVGWK